MPPAASVDVYELVLEKGFREKIVSFYSEFRQKRARRQFPVTVGYDAATDLTLLLKYLAGRLPVSDFELDFGIKGTAVNMIDVLLHRLGEAVGFLARPVDAIKHQAKTVTVGTSRISERLEGIVFATLAAENFSISHLTPANLIVLKNVQGVIREVEGSILYRISGLNLLGEPDENTTIEVVNKARPDSRHPLPGGKRHRRSKAPNTSLCARATFTSAKAARTTAASW